MKIYDKMQQHSEEWYNIRKGKITGSVLTKLISPKTLKISDSKTAEAVLNKIIASKYIIRDSEASMETYAMARGIECEPRARQLYSETTLSEVDEVGFIESDCKRYGMSPDGLVGNDGFIEIKTVNQNKHINAKITNGEFLLIDECYKLQILIGFVLNDNFKYCDFISYNEDFQKDMRLFIFRIHRDEEEVIKVKECLQLLIEKLDKMETKFLNACK